jgi:hypothetical protein
MRILRNEQLAVFQQEAGRRFAERVVLHVGRFFPERCEELGEGGIKEWVTHGIARAQSHRITKRGNVRRYIDLMFTLGRDFDLDPDLPWAGTILRGAPERSETARVEELLARALSFLRASAQEL